MPKSFCDQVVMAVTEEMLESREQAVSDILVHLDHCSVCREAVSRKVAIQRLVGSVEMDPLTARRMAVRLLSSTRNTESWLSPWIFRWGLAVSAASAVVLIASILIPVPAANTSPEATPIAAVARAEAPAPVPKQTPPGKEPKLGDLFPPGW